MEQQNKTKRARDENWSAGEKACLRECINSHVRIIEDKSNDGPMIVKKREAWKQVHLTMLAADFERDVGKLRQQWARMKLAAKQSFSAERTAASATENMVEVPNVDIEDVLVQSMIAHELEEDAILIGNDTYFAEELQENEAEEALEEVPNCRMEAEAPRPKSGTHLDRLRKIRPYKRNVVEERQRQIQKEPSHTEELYLLQSELFQAQIEHQRMLKKTSKNCMLSECKSSANSSPAKTMVDIDANASMLLYCAARDRVYKNGIFIYLSCSCSE